ncbi:hypothetical protein [Actinomadura sp. 6N118]|uniref:hypothetical protein n=1 Tax=Actinomadura sp. 6N118 TaxID=3375151 RepID=UPI0037948973
MTGEQIRHAHALLANPDETIASIARLLGVPFHSLQVLEQGRGSESELPAVRPPSRTQH